MRKVLSLVLALSMVLGMFSFAFAGSLSDIEGEDYQAAVEALMELGVVTGNPDGTYKGNNVVTRAELAKMLVVSLGQEQAAKIAKGSTQFTDVAAENWASGYINVAAQSKIIVGYPDGTFLPDETVSYAEAVTMVLRALGYKNVVESAGTWPTNYITKANELQLLKDMKGIDADAGAKRGNVAILLWNMLRTEMWDIDSENQTNGMTYRKTEEPMLNIKFPDHRYEDEAYFKSVTINDGKIEVEVCFDEDLTGYTVTGEIENIDLLNLVQGMKVAYLYNTDKEVFLTLTCLDTIVKGTVTKVNGAKFEIDDVEYKNESGAVVAVNDYVVCLVDGKKAEEIVVLPTASTKVEKIRTMENKIDEDAVVVIDGKIATRDDIEVDDVYTKVSGLAHLTGEFYAVARERAEGAFESFTVTTNKNVTDRYSIEVDGEEYTALAGNFKAWEDEDNDKEVDIDDLRAKAKDNKYLDKDVELVFNYVGQVIEMNFGEVSDLDAEGDFYVLTSDGSWYTASSKGKTYHVVLAGINGDEDEYDFVNATVGDDFDGINYFTDKDHFEARFYFANMNNDGAVKTLTELADGDEYADKYTAHEFTTEMTDDNYIEGYKITASTIVVTATPVVDDDDNVVEVKVDVTQGPKALEGVEEGILVYETAKNARAKFVFVSEEAESQELNFGLVEEYKEIKGIQYVYISDERYEIADDSWLKEADVAVGSLVAFTNTDGEANMKAIMVGKDVDTGKAAMVTEVDDEFVTFDIAVPVDTAMHTAKVVDVTLDDVKDVYKKYTFALVEASLNEDDEVEFDSEVDVLGEGIDSVTFKKGDRVSMSKDPDVKVVVVVRGLDKDDTITNGKLVTE